MKFNTTIISTLNVLKKQSLLFCLLIVPFSSCLGPKKLNKWVAQQYGAVPVPSKKKNDGIVISSTIPMCCRLPQKQYVLKVDKSLNFKTVKHEKESIQSFTNCQHTQRV